jgi:hypothetical protein
MASTEGKEAFFGRFGNEIQVHDAADLERKLKEINLSVPGRTEGRRSHHRERYCLALYLQTLARHSLLPLPIRVVKGESPDFLFETESSRIALEHTDIATEKSQRAASQLARLPIGTLLEDEDSFRGPNEPLKGHGYVGDQVAQELVPLLLHALDEKTVTLNKEHFRAAERYDLLLYDVSHLVPVAELRRVARLTVGALGTWQAEHRKERQFTTISMLRDNALLYDCSGICGEPLVLATDIPLSA